MDGDVASLPCVPPLPIFINDGAQMAFHSNNCLPPPPLLLLSLLAIAHTQTLLTGDMPLAKKPISVEREIGMSCLLHWLKKKIACIRSLCSLSRHDPIDRKPVDV